MNLRRRLQYTKGETFPIEDFFLFFSFLFAKSIDRVNDLPKKGGGGKKREGGDRKRLKPKGRSLFLDIRQLQQVVLWVGGEGAFDAINFYGNPQQKKGGFSLPFFHFPHYERGDRLGYFLLSYLPLLSNFFGEEGGSERIFFYFCDGFGRRWRRMDMERGDEKFLSPLTSPE